MAKLAVGKLKRSLFWVRTHKIYSLLLLVVLLVAGIFVYEKIALELNKRAFANARTAIDTIYADIVKNVGQPDNYKHENSCSRPNQVYGQGPLSCDVGISIIYALSNKDQASIIFKKVQTIMSQSIKFES